MADDIANKPASNWLLALDTSTDQIGLGLQTEDRVFELSIPGNRQQTTDLLALIDWMCLRARIHVHEVGAIAVAIGPGSFTGLRVALSVAKALTVSADVHLMGVPTLDITANQFQHASGDVVAIAPAGRSRLVWAPMHQGVTGEPRNSTVEELIDSLSGSDDSLVVGEIPAFAEAALNGAGIRTQCANRSPAALLAIGRQRWVTAQFDDPVTLEPAYLHGRR